MGTAVADVFHIVNDSDHSLGDLVPSGFCGCASLLSPRRHVFGIVELTLIGIRSAILKFAYDALKLGNVLLELVVLICRVDSWLIVKLCSSG